ncbi:MAG: metal-dependent transcriptional regulator [Syntrophales bacterium]|jgi:DtxR family Mn-dependent transcriptional regulator|nr:metal-dependent transcriptional regulator [Syntrophales bacterium]MCK9528117.1 metal-dependent transcriptional regulator [Syntrophales bacterium]MDX9921086.1 metal-dependent transcriptional regulator [Syntrophales bacterium]
MPELRDASKNKPLTASMEDYLEAIFDLDAKKQAVRVKDIADRLDVRMPSVTSMLKILNQRGLVNYEKYETVHLTAEGVVIGREMRRKHDALRRFLTDVLKIDDGTADAEACRMEHVLSSETMDRLDDFINFIYTCPRAGERWLRHFEDFCLHGWDMETCSENSEKFIRGMKKPGAVVEKGS